MSGARFAGHVKIADAGALTRAARQYDCFEHVGEIRGRARGAGSEFVLACDLRVAARERTQLGQWAVGIGVVPAGGPMARLSRLVGRGRALEILLVADDLDGPRAERYGYVNRVVADHELFDAALQWARKFAGQAPIALEQIKRISHKGDLDEGIEAELDAFGMVFASDDAREGIGAFLAKRNPRFRGR